MKGRPVDQLVYEYMFPHPKTTDPRNFREILTRHLVYEVRQEVFAFYGHLDTQEAKYPGLDYCHPVHRIRLGRLPWHRRLFRAFDAVGLTAAEIASLTKWEGTKWAKERFEKEQGIIIRDTAADGMPDYRTPGSRRLTPAKLKVESATSHHSVHRYNPTPEQKPFLTFAEEAENDVSMVDDGTQELDYNSYASNTDSMTMEAGANAIAATAATTVTVEGGEESDGEIESIGFQLNEQLRERVAAHNSGDTSLPLDEDWEQWLKSAFESGNMNLVMEHISLLAESPTSPSSAAAAAAVAAVAAATASTVDASSGASSTMGTAFASSAAVDVDTSSSFSLSSSSGPGTGTGTDTDTGADTDTGTDTSTDTSTDIGTDSSVGTGFNTSNGAGLSHHYRMQSEGHLIDLSGDVHQIMELGTSPHRQRRRLRRQNTLAQRVEATSHGRNAHGAPLSASSFQASHQPLVSSMVTAGHHFSRPQRWHRSYSTLRLPTADPPI